jgi:hypothetical protein
MDIGQSARRHQPLVAVALLILCLVLAPVGAAKGQSTAVLSFSPADGTLYLNGTNTIELDLQISGAVSMQGFDLTLTYDPAVVTLDDWDHGGMLSPAALVSETNTPGTLRLAIVQLGGTAPSGEGTLLRLSFSGVTADTSAIQITEAELTNGFAGGVTSPQTELGALTVAYDPGLLEKVSLTGEVSLQGQLQRGGVPFQLGQGADYQYGPYTATSLDQAGANLDFGPVIADTYLVTTAQPRMLNLTADLAKTVSVSAAKTMLNPLRLLAGNAVWTDNVIDAADASLIGASYGLTLADLQPGETLDGDVNFDGIVNLKDLALVAGNYDLTSATVYQDWEP